MKRILCLLVVMLILMSTLTSCIIIPLRKNYEFTREEVSSVRFYDLSNLDSRRGGFHEDTSPVYTLSDEQIGEFLTDFSKVQFKDTLVIVLAAVDPSFYYGDWVVEIVFSDGSFSFYSTMGYGETYNSDGELIASTHFYCEEDDMLNLITKYDGEEKKYLSPKYYNNSH